MLENMTPLLKQKNAMHISNLLPTYKSINGTAESMYVWTVVNYKIITKNVCHPISYYCRYLFLGAYHTAILR